MGRPGSFRDETFDGFKSRWIAEAWPPEGFGSAGPTPGQERLDAPGIVRYSLSEAPTKSPSR